MNDDVVPHHIRTTLRAQATERKRLDLSDVPELVLSWCQKRLGSPPVASLMEPSVQMSSVYGLVLDDGRHVAVKVRDDEQARSRSCVEAQRVAAVRGFPCPHPISEPERVAGSVLHAEEWLPGGDLLLGDDNQTAAAFAALLAQLVQHLRDVHVTPPLPNPPWVRWDHGGPSTWPPQTFLDERDQSLMPPFIEEVARRATARILAIDLPCVLGHADWETQNLRWHGRTPWAVHDWDSLAWLPEAAIAGAACGTFSSAEIPTLAPLDSSRAFLDTYQEQRGEPFTEEEAELAWAASLWPAAHNARGQAPLRPTASSSRCPQCTSRRATRPCKRLDLRAQKIRPTRRPTGTTQRIAEESDK